MNVNNPDNDRYFLVFFSGDLLNGKDVVGSVWFASPTFPNLQKTKEDIAEVHDMRFSSVNVNNIMELNKEDYLSWSKRDEN
ncbi:hypothetical protein [Methylotenera sp.]|uniref:hypothetical protein n=1 Tax=Methylotenera sp. TaxID=2051956 RepID=UPI002486CF4F|nr:hypothetical protein [Methylotenera sp.]MDI1362564.1 hypothetical protein [Methylotenera sp.]